jgi:hypothetical protein
MDRVKLSNESAMAAREFQRLVQDGRAFGNGFKLKKSSELSSASKDLFAALAKDIARHIGKRGKSNGTGQILWPGSLNQRKRKRRHPLFACPIRVPLGDGYCAYGRYEGGACWYDGIGKC